MALIIVTIAAVWGIVTTTQPIKKITDGVQPVTDGQQKTQVEVPVVWGDLGVQMVEAGVIDREAFFALYESRGGLDEASRQLLLMGDNGSLVVTSENAQVILNLLWALGLGTKSSALENGPMNDPKYGSPGGFASTGGWTLSRGNAMLHYSAHEFFALTTEQEALVKKVAEGIYRPCCNNSTYFPDCNHGMAMLGLLQLMASQGATEAQMWDASFAVNTLWFPSQYANIFAALEAQGVDPNAVPKKDLLGVTVSSSGGYQNMLAKLETSNPPSGGTGCRA